MKSPSIPVRLPLMRIAGTVGKFEPGGNVHSGLRLMSEINGSLEQVLPKGCYVLELPNNIEEFANQKGMLGIFEPGEGSDAPYDIHLLGLEGKAASLYKVVKNESQPSAPSSMNRDRKSFMTPTPLHIPDSRVSPIPDSAHEMIYLKELSKNARLKVVPLNEVAWMHRLILVMEKPPE